MLVKSSTAVSARCSVLFNEPFLVAVEAVLEFLLVHSFRRPCSRQVTKLTWCRKALSKSSRRCHHNIVANPIQAIIDGNHDLYLPDGPRLFDLREEVHRQRKV